MRHPPSHPDEQQTDANRCRGIKDRGAEKLIDEDARESQSQPDQRRRVLEQDHFHVWVSGLAHVTQQRQIRLMCLVADLPHREHPRAPLCRQRDRQGAVGD
jgi:hypothetical protein